MARRSGFGTSTFLVLILGGLFVFGALTGMLRLPGSIFAQQAVSYDTGTSIQGATVGYYCNPNWFALNGFDSVFHPCGGIGSIGPQSYSGCGKVSCSYTSGPFYSSSNDNPGNCFYGTNGMQVGCVPNANCYSPNLLTIMCAHSDLTVSNYALTTGISSSLNLLGQDNNFIQKFDKTPPASNPITLTKTVSVPNGTLTTTYNIYRFSFTLRLQIQGDNIQITAYCANVQGSTNVVDPSQNTQCANPMQSAASQALTFINNNNQFTGTLLVDVSVPASFAATPQSGFGVIGQWIAPSGCVATLGGPKTANVAVNPCSNSVLIPNKNTAYSPSPTEPILSSYTLAQAQQIITSGLNPNAVLTFNINKFGPVYAATACTTYPCPSGVSITADYGAVLDIPIEMDVLGYANTLAALKQQTGNVVNITKTTSTNYTSPSANMIVGVKDAVWGLPVAGMAVAYAQSQSNACSTSSGTANVTQSDGTVRASNLPLGTYYLCTTGSSGTITFLVIQFGFSYTTNSQASLTLQYPGQTYSIILVVQPNFNASLTSTSYFLIILAVIAFVVIVIIVPTSLFQAGRGGAALLRAARPRGRRR